MRKYFITLLMLQIGIICFAQSKVKRPDTYNYNRGLEEINNQNYDEALNYMNKEVESDPKNGYAFSWISVIRQMRQEYGRALTAADLALKYLPKKDAEFIASAYVIRGDVYLALADTVKALADYASAIKAYPTHADAYEKRAQIYYEQEKYDLADADYRQLIKLDQGSVMGYMGIGRNRIGQKKWDEAIEQFNRVANMYSDYSSVYSFRAEAYLGKEKWAEATDDIVKALSINGDNNAFGLIQVLKEPAVGMLKAKLKIQGSKNPNESYWPYCIGVIHEHNDEYEKAIPFYEEAQHKDADDMNLRRIAQCYYALGDYEKALDNINYAIELDSTKTHYMTFKAEILHELGDVKGAIAEWDKYMEIYPEYGVGYYSRGWYKLLSGDDDGALDDFTMCITLVPDISSPYMSRGDIYTRQGNTDLAKADYEKVIELEQTPEAYSHLHYAYQSLGEYDKAIAVMDTILAHSEDLKGDYYDAACLYSRMKNKEKALEYLEKSMEYGYNHFTHISLDYDMDFIKGTPEFKALMEKYEGVARAKKGSSTESTDEGEVVTTEVPFTKENGICNVKCKINDLPLYFVFDTGASTVSLSMVEATFMMKNGYMDKKDVVGNQYFLDANGNVSEGTIINVRQVDFGGLKLENVRASVVRNQKAPLLLGQSVLSRLGKIEIDNTKHILKISHRK